MGAYFGGLFIAVAIFGAGAMVANAIDRFTRAVEHMSNKRN